MLERNAGNKKRDDFEYFRKRGLRGFRKLQPVTDAVVTSKAESDVLQQGTYWDVSL